MPYLYCQSCRLTLYEARMFAELANTCPRCLGELNRQPAMLFDKDFLAQQGVRRRGRRGRKPKRVNPALAAKPPAVSVAPARTR